MYDLLKSLWVLLAAFSILGLLSLIPVDKYQVHYLNELDRYKSEPQRRIDATFKYMDAIENGEEDISNGFLTEPPQKYYEPYKPKYSLNEREPVESSSENKYQRPLYVRDKHNPKIIYPYTGK